MKKKFFVTARVTAEEKLKIVNMARDEKISITKMILKKLKIR